MSLNRTTLEKLLKKTKRLEDGEDWVKLIDIMMILLETEG